MLSQDILNALKTYTQNMTNKVSLVLQTGDHVKRPELKEFLSELCSISDNLELIERDENLRSPITFYLEVEDSGGNPYQILTNEATYTAVGDIISLIAENQSHLKEA